MTKYYDLDGNMLFEEKIRYRHLYSVGQDLIHDSKRYEVRGCAWDGDTMYVNVKMKE